MRDRDDSDTSHRLDPEHRSALVDRLYDVALDPMRLTDLLAIWDDYVCALPLGHAGGATPLDDPELEAHLARASVFLGRYAGARADGGYREVLADIPRLAAFISDGVTRVLACNRAAAVAFHISEGGSLASLPFEPGDLVSLSAVIRKVAARRAEKVITLRIRSTITGGPVIVRISPVDGGEPRPLALVLSTELVWPEGFAETVQEAFSLTPAEVEIVRGITLGLPVRTIAEARQRSVDTVRTQMRSILSKTETHSQAELVRVVLGLMDVALTPLGPLESAPQSSTLSPVAQRTLLLPEGRRLDWLEFGDPQGAACLFMHTELGLSRWPASAEREAKARGIRVIVPIRAGYGRSDPHPKGSDTLTAVTRDHAAVLDHLGVERAAVLVLGGELRFAASLAVLRPGLVTGILGCAVQVPERGAAQIDGLDRWRKFVVANARAAPKMLPFLAQAGFALTRQLGKEAFLMQAYGGSAADLQTLADVEVRDAILHGSDICIGARISAHEAFAREAICAQKDWSACLDACKVPILLLQGDQESPNPPQTIRALAAEYPEVEVDTLAHTGRLLFFSRWLQALDRLEDILPR